MPSFWSQLLATCCRCEHIYIHIILGNVIAQECLQGLLG